MRGGTRSLAAPSRNVLEEHLNPHPEFHSSVQGTGEARKDRMGHFQQTLHVPNSLVPAVLAASLPQCLHISYCILLMQSPLG